MNLHSNKLLKQLPPQELESLSDRFELISLSQGQSLLLSSEPSFYFPLSGVIAKVVRMANGSEVATAAVGNEGVIPLCMYLGLQELPYEAVVHCAGEALRIPVDTFNERAQGHQTLHTIMLRFTAAFIAQVSISTACKTVHPIRAQFARWLLMVHDRIGSTHMQLTQENIARMLGARRMSIAAVAKSLQSDHVIAYRRGRIQILDVDGLKRHSCECHTRIRGVYDSMNVM